MDDSQREAMFNAWKEKHDREVKKCVCKTPNPRPTDKNNCFDCDGEIYKDYLDKVRWHEEEEEDFSALDKEVDKILEAEEEGEIEMYTDGKKVPNWKKAFGDIIDDVIDGKTRFLSGEEVKKLLERKKDGK